MGLPNVRASVIGAAICLTIGCRSNSERNAIAAFEDLTSEIDYDNDHTGGLDYTSTLSISGLMPPIAAGQFGYQPSGGWFPKAGERAPSKIVSIWPKHGESALIQAYYRLPKETEVDTYKRVIAIREALTRLRDLVAEELSARLTQSEATTGGGATEGRESNPPETFAARRQKLEEALRKNMDVPNVLITRWNTKRSSEGSLDLGAILSGNSESEESTSGFLILADLRVVSLAIGDDYVKCIEDASSWASPLLEQGMISIPTYLVQAKHVAYVSDMDYSSFLRGSLELSKEEIASLRKGLSAIDKVSIAASLATLKSVGNMGYLTPTATTHTKYLFGERKEDAFTADAHSESILSALEIAQQHPQDGTAPDAARGGAAEGCYTTVYSIRTAPTKDLIKVLMNQAGKPEAPPDVE